MRKILIFLFFLFSFIPFSFATNYNLDIWSSPYWTSNFWYLYTKDNKPLLYSWDTLTITNADWWQYYSVNNWDWSCSTPYSLLSGSIIHITQDIGNSYQSSIYPVNTTCWGSTYSANSYITNWVPPAPEKLEYFFSFYLYLLTALLLAWTIYFMKITIVSMLSFTFNSFKK